MKVPTLYKQYLFISPLSSAELLAQLKGKLADKSRKEPYYGTIDGDKFELKRYTRPREQAYWIKGTVCTTSKHITVDAAKGTILDADKGTIIAIVITSHLGGSLFQMFIIFCFLLNFLGVYGEDDTVNLIMFIWVFFIWNLLLGFLYILFRVNLKKEVKRSKETLFNLLQGTEILQSK